MNQQDLINQYTSEILEVIDHQNDITRSDLQGIIQVIVEKIKGGEIK